jgi:hypothetical protein
MCLLEGSNLLTKPDDASGSVDRRQNGNEKDPIASYVQRLYCVL